MTAVSGTFAAVGLSTALYLKAGTPLRVVLSGSWVQRIFVEEARDGLNYKRIKEYTGNVTEDLSAATYNRKVRLVCFARTSGTSTYAISDATPRLGAAKFTTVPVGSVAYGSMGTNAVHVAGTLYYGSVRVDRKLHAQGIGVLNGATVGTDNLLVALYDASGKLVANSAVAGAVTAGADAFQELAFVQEVDLEPGEYFIGVQCNGTTDKTRRVAASTFLQAAGSSSTGTFGTVPDSITVPTTLTADKAPIAYVYGVA